MTEMWFYHLESRSLDEVLPILLERTLAKGWRAVVRAGSAERVAALDSYLWSYQDFSFLPHGTAADGPGADQPIFLTADEGRPNNAEILFLVDGADARSIEAYQRCVDLFDGRDPAALAAARLRWKQAKAQGYDLTYWQQTVEGQWERKA